MSHLSFSSATMGGSIIPDSDAKYDIGSAERRIRDIFISENSLWVGDEHKIQIVAGQMRFLKRKEDIGGAVAASG